MVILLAHLGALVFKVNAKTEIIDVDNLPIIQRQAEAIEQWKVETSSSIKAWREGEEAKLKELHAKEMAKFNEHLRRIRCSEMKQRLVKDVERTMTAARTLSTKRREASERQEAMRKSNEILAKLKAKSGEESGELSEADDSTNFRSKEDAKAWLKALETSDPSWQRAKRRKMEIIKQTDPNWRSKMDNSEGDGGESWMRHTTHLDTAPSLSRGNLVGDNFIEIGENTNNQDPLVGESDVLAIEKLGSEQLGETKKISTAAQKTEQYAYELFNKERPWLQAKLKNFTQHKATMARNIKKMQATSAVAVSKLTAKGDHAAKCGQGRSDMHKLISDTIIGLPLPEEEKVQAEKPLLEKMEEWLKC